MSMHDGNELEIDTVVYGIIKFFINIAANLSTRLLKIVFQTFYINNGLVNLSKSHRYIAYLKDSCI